MLDDCDMEFRLLTVGKLRKWNLGFEILKFWNFVPFVLIAHRNSGGVFQPYKRLCGPSAA